MASADVETAQLNLGYTTIHAPVTGASSFARIQNGAYVNAQSGPLTYVAQLDPIWVDFSLSEDELLKFRQERKSGQLLAPENDAVSSGQALEIMEQIANEVLPGDFGFAWSGEAREEKQAGGTSALAFVFGLIFVFLILAAQYESWTLPFGVIMAVSFALLGALLAIILRDIPNDMYFQIGLLTLIALAAKNAILIVEFAVELHRDGKSLYDTAVEAAKLRFRPIVMTSFAFILGVVPLAIATGASANSRHSIGTGVIGGMLGATAIAIFFVPMFFLVLEKLGTRGATSEAAGSHDAESSDRKD